MIGSLYTSAVPLAVRPDVRGNGKAGAIAVYTVCSWGYGQCICIAAGSAILGIIMASAGSAGTNYFRRASVFWMAVITFAMGFFAWTVFWPSHVPYEQLGPVGSFVEYLVKNHYSQLFYWFWIAWLIHVGEAAYSLHLCRAKGITDSGARTQWVIQTFLFGIASLSLLLAYKPVKKRR
ncbi:transmembrane protein 254 [Hyperolius riggenbachi]|uniref:transmembrane protein 254 n=1 Tax=Hyperolius riggenbachi TaxID=752182 RepID=UPI0035A3D286